MLITVMRAARALYCFSTMPERPRRMPATVRRLAAIEDTSVPTGRKLSMVPEEGSWRRKGMRIATARNIVNLVRLTLRLSGTFRSLGCL